MEGRDNLDSLNIGGNIILKLFLKKYYIKCGLELSELCYGLLSDYTLHRIFLRFLEERGNVFTR